MDPDKIQAKEILADYAKGRYDERTEEFIGHAYTVTRESALLARVTNKNIGALASMAVTLLQEFAQDSGKKGSSGWPTPEEKNEITKYEKGTTQNTGEVVDDYYKRLGLDRNATDDEIKSAHRNLLRESHPDVLTAQGKTTEEIVAAEEKAKDINEAYYYLSRSNKKEEYDKIWDARYGSGKHESKSKSSPQLPGGVDEISSPYISLSFSPTTGKKPSKETLAKTQGFKEIVKREGSAVNPFFISELKLAGLLPEGFSESQMISAVQLYSRGVNSEDLVNAAQNSTLLSENEKNSVFNTALLTEYLENGGGNEIPGPSLIAEGEGNPSFFFEQSPNGFAPTQNAVSFKKDGEGGLGFVFDQLGGFVKDKAGGFVKEEAGKIAAKTAVGKAIKEGGKKVLKEGSKVIAKTGIKIAGKAGLSAVFESLNAVAPGLGTLLDVLINYVGPLLLAGLKAVFKAFMDPETLGKIIMLIGAGLAGVFGMTGAGLVAGGAGGISYAIGKRIKRNKERRFKTKDDNDFNQGLSSFGAMAAGVAAVVFASMVWPIIIAVVIIPLTLAAVMFMINTSAYVVPPFLPNINSGVVTNPYLRITKTVRSVDPNKCVAVNNTPSSISCSNSELSLSVEYTITISALRGPITITSVDHTCEVNKKTGASFSCDGATPGIVGTVISPTSPYVFSDQNTYDARYTDSLVNNTFTVSGTLAEGGSTTGSASASVCIGDCPSDCPSGWPILPQAGLSKLQATQGPYASVTHSQVEGIDITSYVTDDPGHGAIMSHVVTATHSGIACVSSGSGGNYGKVVWVIGRCNGTEFASVYGHLGNNGVFISSGQRVARGQQLGLADDTGGWNFPHLHYEFSQPLTGSVCSMFSSGAWSRGSRGPIRMEPPFLPKRVPVGCFYNCGVDIP